MRLTGIGSQYLAAFMDPTNLPGRSAGRTQVTLPPDVPPARFWSLTLYDNQTRSMLSTPQRYPRAGSQAYPTPAAVANADGSTTIHVGPEQPADVPTATGSRRRADKGFFAILRLYSPLQPFFDKTWRVGEIEPTVAAAKEVSQLDPPARAQLVLDA